MQENSKKRLKKKVIFIGLLIPIIIVIIGVSYAFFHVPVEKEEEKLTIRSGALALTFRDNDATVENIEGTWNFGDTIEKELVIENTGTRDTYAKISWDNLINTYLAESLTYTLEEKSDDTNAVWKQVEIENINVPRSETASTQLLADHLFVPAGHTYTYRVRITFEDLPDIDQTPDINAKFITKFTLEQGVKKWLAEDSISTLNIKINPNNVVDFANIATTDETADGLFSMDDDYGTSYYYRGTAPNNYIKFGQNADGKDMWWRIIRFNGNGSMRIIYDGTQGWENGVFSADRFGSLKNAYNLSNTDTKYVGWMYGEGEGLSVSKEEAETNTLSSNAKQKLDALYESTFLNTEYEKYISDSIFCNDRTSYSDAYGNVLGGGYGNETTYYGGYVRLVTNKTPTFKCPQKNDSFTVDDILHGNGDLTYPIGLITADEIVAAGSNSKGNSRYFLSKAPFYSGPWYWTMTPHLGSGSFMFHHGDISDLSHYSATQEDALIPVINIKGEYLDRVKGSGTIENPYYFET